MSLLLPNQAGNHVDAALADYGIYRAPAFCRLAGITYRQADYWHRTGVFEPSVAPAAGSGTARLYSTHDIAVARILATLATLGASRYVLATVVPTLRRQPPHQWPTRLLVTATGDVLDADEAHSEDGWLIHHPENLPVGDASTTQRHVP